MILCPWKDILRYAPVIPGLEEAVEKINALTSFETATYPLENGRFMVMSGTTAPMDGRCEAHRNYLDIQYIVKGKEVMGWAPLDTMTPDGEFNTEGDCGFYQGQVELFPVPAGHCYVVFPEDAHAPTRHIAIPNDYTKIVVKLKV